MDRRSGRRPDVKWVDLVTRYIVSEHQVEHHPRTLRNTKVTKDAAPCVPCVSQWGSVAVGNVSYVFHHVDQAR